MQPRSTNHLTSFVIWFSGSGAVQRVTRRVSVKRMYSVASSPGMGVNCSGIERRRVLCG
jgi:hypothetical protein